MKLPRALAFLFLLSAPAWAAGTSMPVPPWLKETFLDFREDVAEAAVSGKRLLVYFGQDGCPYCQQLIQVNFSQKPIVDKTRRHFVATAINIWGDRETTWTNGRKFSEKQLAAFLKVQFTPTLLFFDERGNIVARLNGYYPPNRFEAVLDWVAGRMEKRGTLAEHLRSSVKEGASDRLHDEPFFINALSDLRRRGAKPLAVVFETPSCAQCDELHRSVFSRSDVRDPLRRFDVVRFTLGERTQVVPPEGKRIAVEDWSRALAIAYTPTMVFFGPEGTEVFRIESYIRPFHLRGALEYVASEAYRSEPSFQRFLQGYEQKLRERGEPVDLWN